MRQSKLMAEDAAIDAELAAGRAIYSVEEARRCYEAHRAGSASCSTPYDERARQLACTRGHWSC